MKKLKWETRLGFILVSISILVYLLKFAITGDLKNTFTYLFNVMGFLPINVLLVTLILNQLISIRAKREKMEKLKMVIGIFFSEIGTQLLEILSHHDQDIETIRNNLIVTNDWSDEEFRKINELLKNYNYTIDIKNINLEKLNRLFADKRTFMIRLLENPVLLEHETFTDMLHAAFHLAEELDRRPKLESLPESDYLHLLNDVNRAYRLIALQWLDYMNYLKNNYPFLFSFAMRTNPFDLNASSVVT